MTQPLAEKRLFRVPPHDFIANGTTQGEITVQDVRRFVVGQCVLLNSTTQPSLRVKIKRILGKQTIIVGPEDKPIQHRTDVSAYTLADASTIEAQEQTRPITPEQEIERLTYDPEPRVVRRVHNIDEYGNYAGSAESQVLSNEPNACFFYGSAFEVLRIVESEPGAVVGDLVKETTFTYGAALQVICISTSHRPAILADLP